MLAFQTGVSTFYNAIKPNVRLCTASDETPQRTSSPAPKFGLIEMRD